MLIVVAGELESAKALPYGTYRTCEATRDTGVGDVPDSRDYLPHSGDFINLELHTTSLALQTRV